MRLTSLRLEKFGAFAGRSLVFRPGARLHIVYGANEAGKSTALAAVSCLLFGFPKLTAYGFLPGKGELRVAGVIQALGHPALSFIRRKGDKRTLLDEMGAPVADDSLIPYLGAVSKEVFTNAFGLDAEALRDGAEQLLQSRGDVGESLMAAASGLRGLSELRKSIEAEADEIYRERAQKLRWNEIMRRHDSAEKARREHELLAGRWKDNEEDIAACDGRLATIRDERNSIIAQIDRSRRLKRLAPLIARIDSEALGYAELGELPKVPAGFTMRLGVALDALDVVSEQRNKARVAAEDAARELAQINVDAALLARAAEVTALFSRSGAYAKANEDLPRVLADRDDFESGLRRLAAEIGLPDVGSLEARIPGAPARVLAEKLKQEGDSLAADMKALEAKLAEEKSALAALEQARQSRGALVDPAPLREQFAALSDIRARIERRDEVAGLLRAEERALREEAARLSPSVVDLEALASAPLPAVETLARFRAEFEEAARDCLRLDDEIATIVADIRRAREKLSELDAQGPVPTRERIEAARQRRDSLWSTLVARWPSTPDELASYRIAVSEADRLADEAARDASRVAEHALHSREQAQDESRASDARARRETANAALAQLRAQWEAQWRAADIAPRSPGEMIGWLASLRGLLERRARLAERRASHDHLSADIESAARPVAALAKSAGLPVLEGLDAGRLAARIEERLRTLEAAWREASGAEQTRRDTNDRIAQWTRELEALAAKQAEWKGRWREATPALGLRAEATREEAAAAMEIWKAVPTAIDRRDHEARRVAGMQRDIAAFEAQATALAKTLAPDLAHLPHAAAAKALNERVSEASKAEARFGEGEKRKKQSGDSLATAEKAHSEALAALAVAAALLPGGSNPADARALLEKGDGLLTKIADLRRQLIDHADGLDESRVRADLAGFDPATVEADIATLTQAATRLEDESSEIIARQALLLSQRAEWEKGVGAELAMQQRRNAETELREAAREWAVLKIAALLLEGALAHHRAGQHDPLMQRAGALFATLTGGAFAGLDQEYGDDDQPRLIGRRLDGTPVPIDGASKTDRSPMSTGTLDQLYLALRLAYIEDYCGRAEPIPFIGDDLFTSFDDARTGFGIEALASLSARTQMILFTHHRHVVDIAREKLGPDVDVIELS